MSSLSNISITHTFNGDTAASGLVNTADLDTQLGNLATAQNQTKAALDVITAGDNNLAAQTVGLAQLKPEVLAAIESGSTSLTGAFIDVAQTFTALQTFSSGITVSSGAVTLPATAIADAALSSNVALKNSANTFSALQTLSAGLTISAGAVTLPAASISDSALSSNIALRNTTNTFSGLQTLTAGLTVSAGAVSLPTSTFTGIVISPASTTGEASVRLPHGVAPTSPTNGDVWTTTAGMFVRINGGTVSLGSGGTIGGSISTNQIAVGSGSNTIAGSASFTWNGTSFAVTGVTGLNIAASATTALNISVGTTGVSSLRIGHGVAPTSPVNGDVWTTTAGAFVRINGATQQLASTGVFLPLAGGTMTGEIITVASSSANAGLNIPHGTAPSPPTNGDIWTTTSGAAIRINGGTSNLIIGQTMTANQVIIGGNLGSVVASSTFYSDGTTVGIGTTQVSTTRLILSAGSTSVSQMRFATGSSAPTSPVDGDVWYDGTNIFIRVGAVTKTFTIT